VGALEGEKVANLRIRKVSEEVMQALENRARRNGRSLEEEVYEILLQVLDEEDKELERLKTP
jgi:plasmid stability protein